MQARRLGSLLHGISRTVSLIADPRLAAVHESAPEKLRYDRREGVAPEPPQVSIGLSRGTQRRKLIRGQTIFASISRENVGDPTSFITDQIVRIQYSD